MATVAVLSVKQPFVEVMMQEYVVVTEGETLMEDVVAPVDQLNVRDVPPGPPVSTDIVIGFPPRQVVWDPGLIIPFGEASTSKVCVTGKLGPEPFVATSVIL